MNIFSYGDNAYTETFTRAVENYGIDKFIKKATKVNPNGTISTLNGADRAKIAYLLKEGIADYSGNILDLDVYDPFKAVISTNLLEMIESHSTNRGYKPYVYGDFVGSNSKFNIEDLNEDLRINIERVLRDKGVLQKNMNDEIAKMFGKMVIQYQDHIQPYMKTQNGGVFTPVTRVNAVTDYSNIAELVAQLDMLEMTNNKFSHDQLLEAVNDSMGSDGLSRDKKELLRSVYNKFYYGQSPSNGLVKVLNELGLYKDGKFDITSSAVDENTTELIIEALKPKQEDIESFLNFLNQDGFPVNCSKAQWTEAKECGLLKPLNVKIRKDVSFIADIYKSKNIYYIQIGSAGLFYLSENPAKLAIPKLEGEIDIELRAGRSGSKNGMVGGSLRAQGRLKFKGKSPYTLDDPESIKKLIKETKEISWPDEELRDARNQLSHATFLSDQKRVLVHNLVQHPHPKTHLLINISKGEESEEGH